MAYDRQSIKVDWTWTIDGTDEVANTGFHLSNIAGWTGAAAKLTAIGSTVGWGTDLYAAMVTCIGGGSFNWADYSTLRSVRVAALGTDGLYLVDPLVFESETPTTGSAGQVHPQASIVLSLRSPSTIGRANYGRMYMPHVRGSLQTASPYMSSLTTGAIAAAGAGLLDDVTTVINDNAGDEVLPVIMSAVGSGTAKGVTSVLCGQVVDTQRRRRNRLQETYSSTPFPPA